MDGDDEWESIHVGDTVAGLIRGGSSLFLLLTYLLPRFLPITHFPTLSNLTIVRTA